MNETRDLMNMPDATAAGREAAGARREADNFKQTISGRAFPMSGFSALDIDLHGDVAEGLARICRFGGGVPGNPYSVAQHCVIGADAALEETRDANIAAYFLLHDAHEFVFGDMTTPVAKWLATIADELYGGSAGSMIKTLLATAKGRLDIAIWRAAGMPPPGKTYRAAVDDFDLRMLATEQRQLLMPAPKSWGAAIDAARPIQMRGRLTAWPVAKAAEQYRDRLAQLCPNARRV
ncbi:hypothetical protein EN829_014875 [Mesorhizobium sp. M00.F.Ca.ET.186.01.1.1]|nr:hypothetical protein EN848_14560 [bacterium M00.F.Ca.ET.205.01.1.1]TGU52967.1 hypothetical protein EN795_14835 [bacterium M00.F.Ca.ET.152.01.1.1]TGV35937.1 hypothetical protein EN829_014875 [Mesorhizobium sp. M00.F.Ca.ET.186.01.1.1]TGZ43519.1 hypothetical protein EN805_10445 [bacterium M00.F.Ca.ET.162.01.1.1]